MKRLLNTLFVTSEDIYLSLDGENVVANREKAVVARYPLHTLSGILCFSYAGASPALMGACAQRGIALSFCTPRGKFLARVSGETSGNILLRRTQYRMADDPLQSCRIARSMIFGKLYNSRWSMERTRRDHKLRVDEEKLSAASQALKELLPSVLRETSPDSLRGLEGAGATVYFGVLDHMILNQKEAFFFHAVPAVRRWIPSTRFCPLPTACWLTTAPPLWKAWGWIPTPVFFTGTAQAVLPWRWISWRSCAPAWRTGSSSLW